MPGPIAPLAVAKSYESYQDMMGGLNYDEQLKKLVAGAKQNEKELEKIPRWLRPFHGIKNICPKKQIDQKIVKGLETYIDLVNFSDTIEIFTGDRKSVV